MARHEPLQMVQVEEFDEVFMLTVEEIAVYECPYCKRQVTDFAKNFFFDTGLSICSGMEERKEDLSFLESDAPF